MHKGQAAEEGDKIHSCHDRGNKLLRNNSFFRCLNREFRRIDEEGEHQQEHGDNERIIALEIKRKSASPFGLTLSLHNVSIIAYA